MDSMTIGQLARQADVSVQTVRYYERRCLLPEPPRSPSGYRQYPGDALRRLRFIRRAQDVGFTLAEIEELLDLRTGTESQCREAESTAASAIERVDARMSELSRMKTALASLLDSCRNRAPAGDCPLIEALEDLDDEKTEEP